MTSYEKHREELMKDPEFRKEYDALEPKYQAIQGGISEANVLRGCLDYLQVLKNQGKLWFCRMNSGKALVKKGDKHYSLTLAPEGTADILVITNNGRYDAPNKFYALPLFLEIKSPTGKQTKAQKEFQKEIEAQGCLYRIIRSIDELMGIIR